MNDVIVGVDRSDTARRAAMSAARLAGALGVNLHVVMCLPQADTSIVRVGSEQFRVDALSDAQVFLDDLARTLGPGRATTTVAVGDPAELLCEEAHRLGASTIVVGNRRVQGAGRALGSVAVAVTRRAACDVLVANTSAPGDRRGR